MYRKIIRNIYLAILLFGISGFIFFAFISYFILPDNDFFSIGLPVSIGGGFIGTFMGSLLMDLYRRFNVRVIRASSVDYIRHIGFFSNMKDFTDLEIYKKIDEKHHIDHGEYLKNNDPIHDLHIMCFDESRIWWDDTEAGVFSGNESYKTFITELAQISRGSFNPKEVTENWENDEGPIQVDYSLDNNNLSINPAYIDDYLDIEILREINKQISSSGYRFELFSPFDQTAFIIVLTEKEKTDLRRKRGWSFYPL